MCAFLLFITCFCGVTSSIAQTTQPFLFAETYNSSGSPTGFATLLRNSSTGALTLLSNTTVPFKDPCNPTTIGPTGNFLFGVCGEGVAMYTLDTTTGIVSETPTSPYSVSTGQNGVLVAPESTGQYLYLLKASFPQQSQASTFTLDTFAIDSATPSLVAVNSQLLPFNGVWAGAVADPNRHGFFILGNQEQGGASPVAVLYSVSFDLSTGLANIPTAGLNIGNKARSLAIGPSGGYLALGWGDTSGSLTVYQLSSTDLNLALVASVNLGLEDGSYGSYSFPDSLFFSPGGNLLYVQAPPANFTGGGLPFLVFDPSSVTQLSTPPIQLPDANFLNGLMDPQAPFTYVSDAGTPTYGISVYQIDLSTGLPSQPAPISAPFYPQLGLAPLIVTRTQGVQGIQGPDLGISPGALTFGSTGTGQISSPQSVTLKSLGSQSVSLSSIQITGANSADFLESDNCLSVPVLPTNHTCTIAVTYAPTSVGTSQAALFVTDNAPGSPQSISLSGTAIAAPPPAPAVILNPSATLNFPGTPTQGTSTLPQNVTLTNSGNASLQVSSAVLSGSNVSDFNISSNNCGGAIAANASCTVSIVFSPLASGIRNATLTFTDNAANSPQSITINGTAVPAASFAVASNGGSMTASVSAGQTAQYNLQAVPGAGFTGVLNFSCSGAPTGASCSVPASISLSGGTATNFTVSVKTSGSAAFLLPQPPRFAPRTSLHLALIVLFATLAFLCLTRLQQYAPIPLRSHAWPRALAAIFLITFLNGCGGGSVTTMPPPVTVTPSGTYTITVTPLATALGSTKQLQLDSIPLQLTVK